MEGSPQVSIKVDTQSPAKNTPKILELGPGTFILNLREEKERLIKGNAYELFSIVGND